ARARAMNADFRPGPFFYRQRAAAVIAVDVREQNLINLLGTHRLHLLDDPVEIRISAERNVDHEHPALPSNDVLIRSLQRHVTGIVRCEMPDVWGFRHNRFVRTFSMSRKRSRSPEEKRQRRTS